MAMKLLSYAFTRPGEPECTFFPNISSGTRTLQNLASSVEDKLRSQGQLPPLLLYPQAEGIPEARLLGCRTSEDTSCPKSQLHTNIERSRSTPSFHANKAHKITTLFTKRFPTEVAVATSLKQNTFHVIEKIGHYDRYTFLK